MRSAIRFWLEVETDFDQVVALPLPVADLIRMDSGSEAGGDQQREQKQFLHMYPRVQIFQGGPWNNKTSPPKEWVLSSGILLKKTEIVNSVLVNRQ